MKCLNVIVFYDNYDEIYNYIESVNDISCLDVDIVVVVNKDTTKKVEKLKSEVVQFRNINIFFLDFNENVGYLNSLFLAINNIDISIYKYFILSNTDITYNTKDFYQKLLSNTFPSDVGCIAPSVYVPRSEYYSNPHYKKRTSKNKFILLYWIFSNMITIRMYFWLNNIKSGNVKKEKQQSCFVYSPHGCFMIFSRDFILKIINFQYGVKMYSEEACVGELLRINKMRCYYWSDIEVNHMVSAVTSKINQKNRYNMWRESIKYILKEFY